MTMSLSLVQSLRPSQPEDSVEPRCFEIWTHLSNNLEGHNLSLEYTFQPDDVGKLLTLTVAEVNQSQSCRIEYLPFKTGAFSCLFFIFLTALVGNLTVFANLYSNRRRWSKVNYFIMHLALADLTVLVTPLVEMITMLTHTWYGGRIMCKFYRVLSAFGLYLSSFIVTSIAIDRYLAISRPFSITTASRRARLLLSASFTTAVLCSLPQATVFDLFESSFFKRHNLVCVQWFSTYSGQQDLGVEVKRQSYALFAFGVMYGLPLLCIACCYVRIVCILGSKTREHRENCTCQQQLSASLTDSVDFSRQQHSAHHCLASSGTGTPSKVSNLRRSDTRHIERARICTLRMTAVIVLAFLLCWAPHWVVTMLDTFSPNRELTDRGTDLMYIGLACAFFNSCLNPIIYGMFSKHCSRLISKRCPCLDNWRRRRRLRQQQQLLYNPVQYHQRQQQQRAACQYQMIPMQQLLRSANPAAVPAENTTATASAIAAAAAAAVPASASASSRSFSNSNQQQQQQHLSTSSTRRLERNAFDKMFTPIYGIEISARKV